MTVPTMTIAPRRGEASRLREIDPALAALFLCALGYSLWVLIEGWRQPLLDMHAFRQTQTAIAAFWILHGGPLVDYQTPVLGAPWTAPFEFPLFQWIVAGVDKSVPITLDSAGRLVSYAFFLLTLWPVYELFRLLDLGINRYLVAATVLLLSPIYLFWSRTFMIESTALFFSAAFVAFMQRYLAGRRPVELVLATIVGSLAALVKITTFPPFALAAGLLVLRDFALKDAVVKGFSLRAGAWKLIDLCRRYIWTVVPVIIPCVVALAWIRHSDALKEQNPLGQFLTSARLTTWNWGTWGERFSRRLWADIVFGRSLRDALGAPLVFWILLAAAILCSWRSRLYFVLLFALYVSSFIFFTTLQIVHDYYQYANAVFVVLAVAFALSELQLHLPRWAFVFLLLATCGIEVRGFVRDFQPALLHDQSSSPTLLAARAIKQDTPADSAIFVFGTGWSSQFPYYAERKAVAFPNWTPPALMKSILADPAAITAGRPLSAVVYCDTAQSPRNANSVKDFVASLKTGFRASDIHGCTLFIKRPRAGG